MPYGEPFRSNWVLVLETRLDLRASIFVSMQDLLPFENDTQAAWASNVGRHELGQYFTPGWAAEELVQRFIASERPASLIEPSCGDGSFLRSIPREIPACGVEIDPFFAEKARRESGRVVFEGAFQSISRDQFASAGIAEPSHYIGNPPFSMVLICEFLETIYRNSGRDATCGFILPAYVFQTANTVARINQQWGVEQQLIPRDLFPGLSTPILWAILRKHSPNRGFILFEEKFAINSLKKECREILHSSSSTWKDLVACALRRLGNRASMTALYAFISSSPIPETNNFWREKVRQTLQRYDQFLRVDRGVWELAA